MVRVQTIKNAWHSPTWTTYGKWKEYHKTIQKYYRGQIGCIRSQNNLIVDGQKFRSNANIFPPSHVVLGISCCRRVVIPSLWRVDLARLLLCLFCPLLPRSFYGLNRESSIVVTDNWGKLPCPSCSKQLSSRGVNGQRDGCYYCLLLLIGRISTIILYRCVTTIAVSLLHHLGLKVTCGRSISSSRLRSLSVNSTGIIGGCDSWCRYSSLINRQDYKWGDSCQEKSVKPKMDKIRKT